MCVYELAYLFITVLLQQIIYVNFFLFFIFYQRACLNNSFINAKKIECYTKKEVNSKPRIDFFKKHSWTVISNEFLDN